jgi:hypothetical protein
MFEKALLLFFSFTLFIYSESINTDKNIYNTNEKIKIIFDDIRGDESDWIAIYTQGSNHDFGNIIQWSLTGAIKNGEVNFDSLARGKYDAKLFYGHDFVTSKSFGVEDGIVKTDIKTSKDVYSDYETIKVNFQSASGDNNDWIGLYPKGVDSQWGNQLQWSWTNGKSSGEKVFNGLPAGEYEVRIFFNNSFHEEASYGFKVEALNREPIDISLNKNTYDPFELIYIDVENIKEERGEWVGIFNVGDLNQKKRALQWRKTKQNIDGVLSFNGLPKGEYEARVFSNNIFQKTVPFKVRHKRVTRVLYDDFEDGKLDSNWVRVAGKKMKIMDYGIRPKRVQHTERKTIVQGQKSLRTFSDYDKETAQNRAAYYYNFQNPDPNLKFLELDMRTGISGHVIAFGVKIKTKFGDRRIEFAAWLNHTLPSGEQIVRGPYGNVLPGHRQAFSIQDGYLQVHPGPSDYHVGTTKKGDGKNMFVYYNINIEEALRVLEPDNEFRGMILFTTSGGDYDNLALRTH